MKTNVKIDGVMVLTGVAVVAAAVIFYKLRGVVSGILAVPEKIVGSVVGGVKAVNSAVPPSMTFNQKQPDGTVKKVVVSGAQIKRANANPSNMGMVAWPSLPPKVPEWYEGSGYQMEEWEKDNPFGYSPAVTDYDPVQAQKTLDFMDGKSSVVELIKPAKKWSMFGG
jgi:hypothetical protein